MASLALQGWPFPDNQDIELFWFGSPYMDYRENWRIRVAFRTPTGEIKVISFPWGTIPTLRLGQIYSNGISDPIKALSGDVLKVTINNLNQGVITNGFRLPKRLIDFGKNPELGLQRIIQFQSEGLTICIPLIEFVRALFINSKYLAYYLLQPHGLELLVEKSDLRGKTLHFDLTSRVPAKHATDTNARHLSWIYTDSRVRSMWDSVYNSMFSQAIKDSPVNPSTRLKKGLPLNIELPDLGPLELHVRGERFMDHVLVKEIIGVSGFNHPASEILFWHPSKKHRESAYGDRQVRIVSKPTSENYILNDESENSKEDVNQDILEAPLTVMQFNNYPVVNTRSENVQHSNKGKDVIVISGRGGKNLGTLKEVSTQDSMVGGDTPPIDFQSLETIPSTQAFGLEDFFSMIQLLKQEFAVGIRMSVLRVPTGKRFSICPNGSRRTCAIVQVTNTVVTKYIVEVARPDNWSISTLILEPTQQATMKSIERDIKFLLEGLVEKNGHWDQSVLNLRSQVKIDKVKHYQSDSARDWAYRIANKLIH
ncbi:hypothetical protein FHS18_003849 [Paenibacillus phyllosphaerae]|uniref:TnsE C-terminal domain-containing protein n=1 Tax=Paenibacillus phyllosphaerae TaxID=274593 RepID=A0A7W5B0R2_9BACL|nr:Tn7-like element transposition protein TnsE [Paenibacillus phyllosphaerae]MBB3111781.1 hypothetical protein [Paenibacillus phyllosphaerae]